MRTLQRLSHTRYPPGERLARRLRLDGRAVLRQEARLWRRRLQWMTGAILVLGAGWFALLLVSGNRRTADGLVQGHPIVLRAPAQVGVSAIYCRPGSIVEADEPLVLLRALDGEEERRALELVVRQRRLELALLEGGGDLERTDPMRRIDLSARAELEERLAAADGDVAAARLASRLGERRVRALELEVAQLQQAGRIEALEERVDEARALVARARVHERQAQVEAGYQRRLSTEGVASASGLVSAESEQEARLREVEGLGAVTRALDVELATARSAREMERRRDAAALAELDAAVETARREVGAAEARRAGWEELAARRRGLLPAEPADGARLAALELDFLRARVAEAEARLEDLDRRMGNRLLRAECRGVVDRVFAREGAVLERDAPVLSYHDPGAQRVVVYARPEIAAELHDGQPCFIVPEDGGASVEGRVAALGLAWTPCPEELPRKGDGWTDLRMPVTIDCAPEVLWSRLRPNMRVKVVFHEPGGRGDGG